MSAYIFQTISKDGAAAGVTPGTEDARDWFRDRASMVGGVSDTALMRSGLLTPKLTRADIGRMYMYFYDPKHKKTLPYYDRFPLIFVTEFNTKGHVGINLHYLAPLFRARLMDALYSIETDDRIRQGKKLAMSYATLKGAAKFRYFKPCVKQYLKPHVKSRFLYIPYEEWDIALFLPTERFEKASARRVWNESVKKV